MGNLLFSFQTVGMGCDPPGRHLVNALRYAQQYDATRHDCQVNFYKKSKFDKSAKD
jgi:hypothetical protein